MLIKAILFSPVIAAVLFVGSNLNDVTIPFHEELQMHKTCELLEHQFARETNGLGMTTWVGCK